MPDCRRKLKCQGGLISGELYFLVFKGQKIEHCSECAAEELRPSISSDLKDVSTLINTFGSIADLGSLGGTKEEVVDGQTKTKVFGWLGGVTALFQRKKLWFAMSSGRTLLGEAQFLVAEHMVAAIVRMLPHATGFHQKKVERQLNHARSKFEESKTHRTTVQEYHDRNVMVPKEERSSFFNAARDAYQNAKTVVTDLAPSFRTKKQRALLEPQDVRLLDILIKGVEELKSEEAEKVDPKPAAEDPATSAKRVPETGSADPADQGTEKTPEPAVLTISDLPDNVRIIKAGKRIAAPKKEQDRARKLLKEHGGVIMATEIDENAPLSQKDLELALKTAAANGGPRVSRRGTKREEKTTA